MKKVINWIIVLAACSCLSTELYAQKKEAEVYNITEAELVKFVNVFPEIRTTIGNISGDETALITAFHNVPMAKWDELAKKGGFKDGADLLRVCGGAVIGYAMLKMEEAEEQLNQKLSGLPPEMEALIKPQLDALKLQLKKYEGQVSKETLDAVRKYYEEMDKLFMDKPF